MNKVLYIILISLFSLTIFSCAKKSSDDSKTTTDNTTTTSTSISWVKQFGTSSDDFSNYLSIDSSENIYIVGTTTGKLNENNNFGGDDIFLIKFDNSGNIKWTRQIGSTDNDSGNRVTVDSSNNVYVTGYVKGSLDNNTYIWNRDAFLIKYDSEGNKKWSIQFGTVDGETAYGIDTDKFNNVYVAGNSHGSMDNLTQFGNADIFLSKYDSNGANQWTRQIGSSAFEVCWDIKLDSLGNSYVVGRTDGSIEGTNYGSADAVLLKYDSNGNKIWSKQFGTSKQDHAISLSIDSLDNVYVTGSTQGDLGGTNKGCDDGIGETCFLRDIYLSKYDSSGNHQWINQIGTGADDQSWRMTVDFKDNIYITGYTNGDLEGNTNIGNSDIFILKYNTGGIKQWTKLIGTSAEDKSTGIYVDSNENIFISGYTQGSLNGNINKGGFDSFLLKMVIK
jgi:hypothetical protein